MKILIFGDSVTQGFNDTEYGGWVNRLATYVIRKNVESDFEYNRMVFNLGISGEDTRGLLLRIDAELGARLSKRREQSVILFVIGVNDSQYEIKTGKNKVPISTYEDNLRELVVRASVYTKEIIFVGIPPVDESKLTPMPWKVTHGYDNRNIQSYNDVRKKICEEEKISYICMDNVFTGSNFNEVLSDGIHPNSNGHRLMFEKIQKELKKLNIL